MQHREFHRHPLALQRFAAVAALAALGLGALTVTATAADDAPLAAFSAAAPGEPPAAWKFATLPNKAPTKFSIADLGGARVLKVEAVDSYGNLVHTVRTVVSPGTSIAWRWRVDKLVEDADLKVRSGDDSAAKLCLFFGFDGAKLPLGERTKLALARSATGQDVPTQTLCYVWDNKLAPGTVISSPFTRRVRFQVLESGGAKLGQWASAKRNVSADYLRVFGDEAEGKVPELTGVAVSADADNTHGNGLAYFGDISLMP